MYITLHTITLHCVTLRYVTLLYIAYHTLYTIHFIPYITYVTLHTLHTLHTLYYITLHYIALHCIESHYITWHDITYIHYITLHTYIHYTWVFIYVYTLSDIRLKVTRTCETGAHADECFVSVRTVSKWPNKTKPKPETNTPQSKHKEFAPCQLPWLATDHGEKPHTSSPADCHNL